MSRFSTTWPWKAVQCRALGGAIHLGYNVNGACWSWAVHNFHNCMWQSWCWERIKEIKLWNRFITCKARYHHNHCPGHPRDCLNPNSEARGVTELWTVWIDDRGTHNSNMEFYQCRWESLQAFWPAEGSKLEITGEKKEQIITVSDVCWVFILLQTLL